MRFTILTAFPQMVQEVLNYSIPGRAAANQIVHYRVIDLRRYTSDLYRTIDDLQYGGGFGMILKPEPFFRAIDALTSEENREDFHVIYTSPRGKLFTQRKAEELLHQKHLVFFCGHYKGVDERVREALVDEEISVGDFVLSGGELPVLMIIDALVRLIPGVLTHLESAQDDSLMGDGLLEGPLYTRPAIYRGRKVPEVLLSGNHQKIADWRRKMRLEYTKKFRKDLLTHKDSEENYG